MDDKPEKKVAKAKAPARKRPVRKAAVQEDAQALPKEVTAKTTPRKSGKTGAKKPVAKSPAKAKKPRTDKAAPKASNDLPEVEFAQSQSPDELAPVIAEPEALSPLPAEPRPLPVEPAPLGEVPVEDVVIHPPEAHAPLAQPHDEGLEFGLSPVDLAPDPAVREEQGFGWFTKVMLATSAMLVLFNSFAIDKWAREQPVTAWNSQALIAAQQLHAGMKGLHLDVPLESLRSTWHAIRDAHWPGSETADKPPVK